MRIGTLTATVLVLVRATCAADRRPNVLLVLTDDQGFGDVALHGTPGLDTPVLDRFAGESVRFDRFYVSSVCAPTRASLLTGRYHQRAGVTAVSRGLEFMRPEEITIAEILKPAGYRTGCFGKWHNGSLYPYSAKAQGFDDFFGFEAGGVYQWFDRQYLHNGRTVSRPGYITDVLTDEAIDFIRQNRTRPFFCYLAYNAPHKPYQVPDRYFDKYKKRKLPDDLAALYGMVECVDHNMGRLLETLKEVEIDRDTLVIFTSDNGPTGPDRPNDGMKGRKAGADEGSTRVPCFVRLPGVTEAGGTIETIAAHIDLLPTLAELCGAQVPENVKIDGASLVPLLRGHAADWPERTLFQPGVVRTRRWRVNVRRRALYDMPVDPGQKRNVASQHRDVMKDLVQRHNAWSKDVRSPDRKSFLIGHPEAESDLLTVPLAKGEGYRCNNPWSSGHINQWSSTNAVVTWPVTVVAPGESEVYLKYVCAEQAVGTRFRIAAGHQSVEAEVTRAIDPGPVPQPDRVPQTTGVVKRWGMMLVGTLSLTKGDKSISLRPTRMPSRSVFVEVRGIELRRIR